MLSTVAVTICDRPRRNGVPSAGRTAQPGSTMRDGRVEGSHAVAPRSAAMTSPAFFHTAATGPTSVDSGARARPPVHLHAAEARVLDVAGARVELGVSRFAHEQLDAHGASRIADPEPGRRDAARVEEGCSAGIEGESDRPVAVDGGRADRPVIAEAAGPQVLEAHEARTVHAPLVVGARPVVRILERVVPGLAVRR